MNKLIVILGPTATGKTKLAVFLAQKFNGEIISADSRQVYKGMNIGTGKDLKEYTIKSKIKNQKSKTLKVPYHLIDVISPNTEFNAAKFKKRAIKAIDNIIASGKMPLLVGGTGLYISAITDNYQLPQSKPNKKIRRKLEKIKMANKLKILQKLDKATYAKIDKYNLRRVDRALEVCLQGNKFSSGTKGKPLYDILQIGIKLPKNMTDKKIDKRVGDRMFEGMVEEIIKLHKQGVSWRRMENFGLEYRYISRYLRGVYDKQEMINLLKAATHQFAKRQMNWFKRDKRIRWIKNKREAANLITQFLKDV
ncbi:MAG: tRNA (adenosine(37)-N6)-dimethylallyltransferase MiaA [Candidatus Kuenenbacteria bacterium]